MGKEDRDRRSDDPTAGETYVKVKGSMLSTQAGGLLVKIKIDPGELPEPHSNATEVASWFGTGLLSEAGPLQPMSGVQTKSLTTEVFLPRTKRWRHSATITVWDRLKRENHDKAWVLIQVVLEEIDDTPSKTQLFGLQFEDLKTKVPKDKWVPAKLIKTAEA